MSRYFKYKSETRLNSYYSWTWSLLSH